MTSSSARGLGYKKTASMRHRRRGRKGLCDCCVRVAAGKLKHLCVVVQAASPVVRFKDACEHTQFWLEKLLVSARSLLATMLQREVHSNQELSHSVVLRSVHDHGALCGCSGAYHVVLAGVPVILDIANGQVSWDRGQVRSKALANIALGEHYDGGVASLLQHVHDLGASGLWLYKQLSLRVAECLECLLSEGPVQPEDRPLAHGKRKRQRCAPPAHDLQEMVAWRSYRCCMYRRCQ
eukprot:6479891-Amphidinium_carterae.1